MPIVVPDIAAVIVTVIAVFFTVATGTAVVDVAVFERDRFFILLHPL